MTVGQFAAVTDPGRRRQHNEDSYVLEPPLFAVADGMGGAQAGEIASRLAASVFRDRSATDGEEGVVDLIQEANRRVYEAAERDESRSGMGTTVTVALVEDAIVRFGHVGDSRAYRIRHGRLEQLTQDHSLVAELVRSGKLSPEEADVHPQRSVITRALGTDPDVDVDRFSVAVEPGDVFLLCSDGLTTMVDDDAILATVERRRGDLRKAGEDLVNAANKHGGEDNITIVLFEITVPSQVPDAEPARDVDEDTLSGLQPLPPIDDTMVVRPEPTFEWEDDSEAAPAQPRRRPERRISRTVLLIGSVATIMVITALVVWALSRSYFVGATRDGRVAVYQGFPWDIAGNVRLYRLRYESRLHAGQLSQSERRKLLDHDLTSYGSALRKVRGYEAEVVP